MKVTLNQKERIIAAKNEVESMSSRALKKWMKENYYNSKESEEEMRNLVLNLMVSRIVKGNAFRDQTLLTEEI